MKKIIFFFLIAIAVGCTTKTPTGGFKLLGTITNLPDGDIILKQSIDGNWQGIDTVKSTSGTFTFEGKVEMPEMYRVVIADTLPPISLFIDNNEIRISGTIDSLSNVKISGSKTQHEFEAFKGILKPYTNILDSIDNTYSEARLNKNEKLMDKLSSDYDSVAALESNAMKQYIGEHKNSVISAYITWSQIVHEVGLNELDSITTQFDSTLNASTYVKLLKNYITVLRNVEIGKPAVDFTMNDIEGNPVTLSSLYGKYLLIDFWASWCGPCRRENPNVVNAYKKYNKKGFDILGVSFDKSMDNWLKAIKDDNLTWHHVSDLKYWNNEAGKLYGIRSIPSNVLLDPNGIIIAKNLRGEDLMNKLKELLK